MSAVRPDPDALLARVQREEQKAKRGKLRIFFGATAGVGKTYKMLEEAQSLRARGVDVVVGYVEPHGRAETEALLEGLERLPFLEIRYRGTTRRDFDLDAALARKPAVLLVDELAHTNPLEGEPRPRHAKRWQDIEEVLDAGIDVYTTVNVQHVESLNDVVTGITGVQMLETVPDSVFESADEVELIDTPPDELLARLHAGKVYIPEQARNAIENFFRKGNLIALRELALRTTAERVDRAMEEYRTGEGIRAIWAAGERLLVAIGPDEQGERLVRAGKRMAVALHAEWIVVYVETPDLLRMSEEKRDERIGLLRLAESLGAEAVTLSGRSAGEALAEYAHERNVSRIVIGRPRRPLWRRLFRPSTYGELLANVEGIDVLVVGGADERAVLRSPFLARSRAYLAVQAKSGKPRWPGYAWGVVAPALCTLAGIWTSPLFELTNIAMVYLLAVALIAARYGRGPAVASSILAVAAFDFFFVPPHLTFAVSDIQYLITFAIMLAVALLISNLTASVRLQANVAGHRERRTALLYAMSRELAATRGQENMALAAVRHMSEVFESQVAVLLPDAQGKLRYPKGKSLAGSLRGADLDVAQWVQGHGEPAGLGTDTLPGSEALYVPLKGTQSVLGVLAVLPANPRRVLLPEQFHLLETFSGQIALALERAQFAEHAERASIDAETEGLRNALLASISHDLRTPLAVISGASSSLVEKGVLLTPQDREALARSIFQQSQQMAELVANVLQMTRLEGGTIALERDWHALGELAGSVLSRLRERLAAHPVQVELGPDVPLVRVDATLLEQVLANLLENAAKHTPPGTAITLSAEKRGNELLVSVRDGGLGLPPGDPEQLFAKFHRGTTESAIGGVGLGLAICRAIVHLHGGRIWAERPPQGAAFLFTLPLEAVPAVPPE
ncbi:MAG TPA: sensor histidine kinase KdpD [Burkholderiales bacterium]|jgi:two-component system sensor histidine kinase KdpD|nr:sensor histidine kinase KdpD [Burkholderiales bacterium]